MEWLTFAKAGLILNTIGAIVLIIGSNKIINVLNKFVETVSPTYGTYGQGRVASRIKELGDEFYKVKKKSLIINYIGYFLFAIGFVFQLF